MSRRAKKAPAPRSYETNHDALYRAAVARYEIEDEHVPDDENPRFLFSLAHNDLVVAIATGRIDARALALAQLANRGLDLTGNWVGFERAAQIAADALGRKAR